jgi:hypothetical protein
VKPSIGARTGLGAGFARSSSRASTESNVSATCRASEEARTRALLMQTLAGGPPTLRRLESRDLEDHEWAAVTAFMTAPRRVDPDIKQIVGRLSIDAPFRQPGGRRWLTSIWTTATGAAGQFPVLTNGC